MNLIKSKKNLVLIGMMGSGKTHLGANLAKKLNYEFYDTDHLIENHTNLSLIHI